MRRRLWSEGGFGLVELLIAMAVLQIAVFSLIAALSSGHVALLRSAKISTASALASAQIEQYRAVQYHEIRLDPTRVTAAVTADAETSYQSDPAYSVAQAAEPCPGLPDPDVRHICNPSSLLVGADGRTFRVNTYIVYDGQPGGRDVKRLTVVVRDPRNSNAVLVRQSTAFDELTGR